MAYRAGKTPFLFDAITVRGGIIPIDWAVKISKRAAPFQTQTDYDIPTNLDLSSEMTRFFRIGKEIWRSFCLASCVNPDRRDASETYMKLLLYEVFGFSDISPTEPKLIADHAKFPIGHEALDGMVPIIIAPSGFGLDTRSPLFGDNNSNRSPFRLAQLYLNNISGEKALWGIVTDGHSLRLVRKNSRQTTDAWIDANLKKIFSQDLYADFALLWLLCHASRFGRIGQKPHECILESWRTHGNEEGRRAYDLMGHSVQEALEILGDGFLRHRRNDSLRTAIGNNVLSSEDFFNQLLRLVYRLIFLLTVEERKLLFPNNSRREDYVTYQEGYSVTSVSEYSTVHEAYENYCDRWEAMKVIFAALSLGDTRGSLPGLVGIFSKTACPDIDAAEIDNNALLEAVYRLAWLDDGGVPERVNLRDIGPEELGSVYEGLLELIPQTKTTDTGRLSFTFLSNTRRNARKTSGSYYTPECLVKLMLELTLDTAIQKTIERNPGNHVNALLNLTIVDPACGSGHFLLAAARKLASHIAGIETGGFASDTDTYLTEYRQAIRQVISMCIFGVDLNPMAVELCKVSLWLEAVVPGLPLTFLDSHIQWGNSLLGTTDELMKNGIPDAAWEPITGDDKKAAYSLRKQNKESKKRSASLNTTDIDSHIATTLARDIANIEAHTEGESSSLTNKHLQWDMVLRSPTYQKKKFAADLWCSAFAWPKQAGKLTEVAPTTDLWSRVCNGEVDAPGLMAETASMLAEQYRFFHWGLQFPQVFAQGGFDVVVSNPPWERVKMRAPEFFAQFNDDIAHAPTVDARKKLITQLPTTNPKLWKAWQEARRKSDGESHITRNSQRFPLCGKGDVNTYALFAEHIRSILRPQGRAGFIVPQGIATDDTTKDFFGTLVDKQELASVYGFENEDLVFRDVHHAYRFALVSIAKTRTSGSADLLFFARNTTAVLDTKRHFTLALDDFSSVNPNTKTCPTFRSQRDAQINISMYRRAGVLWNEVDASIGNPWKLRFMRMFDAATDSHLFLTHAEMKAHNGTLTGNHFVRHAARWSPLFEGKMAHHFDHRFGTYEGQSSAQQRQRKLPELNSLAHMCAYRVALPNYWVSQSDVEQRLSAVWKRGWFLGWRDICSSTVARTVIASVIPKSAVVGSFPLMLTPVDPQLVSCLFACLCSFALDYAARQKVGGVHLAFYLMKQLPIFPPTTFLLPPSWDRSAKLREWILPRVLELSYTAWDLQPFARDVGYNGPPFRWNTERRFLLRCELDAAFFHLYKIPHDDVDFIMDTFPVIKKNDEAAHGEYRTKRTILEIYDAMAFAERTGRPYATLLNPPPADAAVAHESRSEVVETQPAPALDDELSVSVIRKPKPRKGRR